MIQKKKKGYKAARFLNDCKAYEKEDINFLTYNLTYTTNLVRNNISGI